VAVLDASGRANQQPDKPRLTDITERTAAQGQLYLCAVKDARSNPSSATPWATG
jgi:hypothetical protein